MHKQKQKKYALRVIYSAPQEREKTEGKQNKNKTKKIIIIK